MPDFLPRREPDLLAWSNNFDRLINLDPGQYSLSPEQAADYHVAHLAFAAALQVAGAPETRTRGMVAQKNAAMAGLKERARALAAIARPTPGLTDEQRIDLGLNVPKPTTRRVGVPAAPRIALEHLDSRKPWLGRSSVALAGRMMCGLLSSITVRLGDAESAGSARPYAVVAANVFTFVGDEPPADLAEWTLAGQTSRTAFNLDIGVAAGAGEGVWIAAQWLNTRGEAGAISQPTAARTPSRQRTAA